MGNRPDGTHRSKEACRNMESGGGKATEMSNSDEVSTRSARIAELAKQMPDKAMHSLSRHMDITWLRKAYARTRKSGAVGVDGQTAEEYARNLEENLAELLGRAKSGRYRAPPVRRVHIPKGNGETRPLGIPTFEDKVLQRAIAMLLEPVYEEDFLDCSYGFRPGRSAHQALGKLRDTLMDMGGGWVLEVDIRKYFDTIDRGRLQEVLHQRVSDGVVKRLVGKWLNAGVLEEGVMRHPTTGTPQGGVISPLLANIYLHTVLDTWFVDEVLPRLRGRAVLVRFADDFVIAFEREDDALRVRDVLPKRFGRFGLEIHPLKTRLLPFHRPSRRGGGSSQPGVFSFLGFKLYWARSKKGYWVIWLNTARDRFTSSLKRLNDWCRRNRHRPVRVQWQRICRALVGHYAYYGVIGNHDRLFALRYVTYRLWRMWLTRRSQRARVTWKRMRRLVARYPLPPPPQQLRSLRDIA